MPAAGPNFPSAGADNAGTGSVAWTNPGSVLVEDGTCATCALPGATAVSHYLFATGFGFAIPAGATINGLEVDWKRSAATSATALADSAISLVQGGAVAGANRAVSTNWPTTLTWVSYGSTTDVWGLTLGPSDINAANFGAALAVNASAADTANIDACRITVWYTAAASAGGAVPRFITSVVRVHPAYLE